MCRNSGNTAVSRPVSCMARTAMGACGSDRTLSTNSHSGRGPAKTSRKRGRRASICRSASSEGPIPWRATNSKRRSASWGSESNCWGARKWARSRCTLKSALARRVRQSRNWEKRLLAWASADSSARKAARWIVRACRKYWRIQAEASPRGSPSGGCHSSAMDSCASKAITLESRPAW